VFGPKVLTKGLEVTYGPPLDTPAQRTAMIPPRARKRLAPRELA
jgi:hypothetical protein